MLKKISRFFKDIPGKKYISALLIATIFLSQTVHVNFFDRVNAGPEDYHDIVSIIVDTDTYRVQRQKIQRYAEDIGAYLGGVRTTIIVVAKDTPPSMIATKNENLYTEGDGESGISALVGTVLIGDVPIPMVEKNTKTFASLYPYVDFVDKAFVYDQAARKYVYGSNMSSPTSVETPEIWHGVINPAVGRVWNGADDIAKIGQFLDKTHEFYTKSGKFAPMNTPPKVLYYDGFSESKSISARALFQYNLFIQNRENVAYNRFTKYLLGDISHALQSYDAKSADPDVTAMYQSLGIPEGSDSLSDEQIKATPDIKTKEIILAFLKNFKGIFNEKTLGDELKAVHNAGRYNSGSNVRVDIAPVSITLMDTIARDTLLQVNTALEQKIDTVLQDNKYARRLPIFDEFLFSYSKPIQRDAYETMIRQGYYFGKKAATVTTPDQCTVMRGSTSPITSFGRSQLVEATAAFDILSVEPHINTLTKDTEMFARVRKPNCFGDDSKPKLQSYWGGNSVLRLATSETGSGFDLEVFPSRDIFSGFTSPILSLGGMRESSRLPTPSVANCMKGGGGYVLPPPRIMTFGGGVATTGISCSTAFPMEWTTPPISYGDGEQCMLPMPDTRLMGLAGDPAPRYTCISDTSTNADMYSPLPTVNGVPIVLNPGAGTIQPLIDKNHPTLTVDSFDFDANIGLYLSKNDPNTPDIPPSSVTMLQLGDCHYGSLYVDGTQIIKKKNLCVQPAGDSDPINTTYFKDTYYHTISSIYKHISPTVAELAAAERAGATPSLAVDMVRYVEFVTPKGNIARLDYPNFFALEGQDVAGVRSWLKTESERQWKSILDKENATTLNEIQERARSVLGGGTLPTTPIDWNTYISDDAIIKALQAKNWLHPDISTKYKQALQSLLSYSHAFGGDKKENTPPSIPSNTEEYEIAYLGIPEVMGVDFSQSSSLDSLINTYNTGRRQIEGLNISEEDDTEMTSNPATQCGPPEGVSIFQWPAAILCWIKAQFPPKILAGSCGPTTIGITSSKHTLTSPSVSDLESYEKQVAFYTGSRVIPELDRSSMRLQDTISIKTVLEKSGKYLSAPTGATATIEVVAGDASLVRINPSESPVSEDGAGFTLESTGKAGTVSLKVHYTLVLPGENAPTIRIDSAPFDIRITPEYYSIFISQSGSPSGSIDVTSGEQVLIQIGKIGADGVVTPVTTPLRSSILDDISGTEVHSGSIMSSLPLDITKKIGTYRLLLRDEAGISGEVTFVVRSGTLSQTRVIPVSTALVSGADTLATIRLLDRLGNPVTTELHSLKVDISGGYIVDTSGEHRSSITLDVMEPEIPIQIGSSTPGSLKVTITVDDKYTNTTDIRVYESAQILISFDGQPEVGGPKIPGRISIQDTTGNTITGLSSVAALSLSSEAGRFSKDTITITDGVSEPFFYIPSTVSGDHLIKLDIPGVGSLADKTIPVRPGKPMYIDHVREGDTIIFSLRDRYGNLSNVNLGGTLTYNADDKVSISFTNGTYRMPFRGGYYVVDIPTLKENIITYTDDTGSHSVAGLEKYAAYINPDRGQIDFAPDYNARYTVLAGGSFLREGEDILYNTTPGQSQSLAVTTVLENPYTEDTLFTLYPGGAYILGSGGDRVVESSISIMGGYPVLTVKESVSRRQVAQVRYRMQGAILKNCSTSDCTTPPTTPTITLSTNSTDLKINTSENIMSLLDGSVSVVRIGNDGSIALASGVQLVPHDNSSAGLEMGIEQGGEEIATVVYSTDLLKSVDRGNTGGGINTPQLLYTGYAPIAVPSRSLGSNIYGYQLVNTSTSKNLDEEKRGPNHTDSIGFLEQVPGVGWQGNNTMLLSYAGGDTVGEASKFFHTYTLINLGDPVTHVDNGIDPVTKKVVTRPQTQIDGIDRTLGSTITRSYGSNIANYQHRDVTADGLEDILTMYGDGYIELSMNLGTKFRSRGMIAHIPDLSPETLTFGDFTHDGYADIIGVNKSGDLVLVDNIQRKFTRKALSIQGGSSIPKHISQFKIYDMDADGRDDIVYLSAGGQLGILYGTDTPGVFVRKVLDEALGISLDTTPITVGGAIRTNTTPKIVTHPTIQSMNPAQIVGAGNNAVIDATESNAWLLDDVATSGMSITTQGSLPVNPTTTSPSTEQNPSTLSGEVFYQYRYPSQSLAGGDVSVATLQNAVSSVAAGTTPEMHEDTYVKSQYAPAYNLQVEKRFTNTSNTTLHPDDRIIATVRIKNTSTAGMKNAEYLDTVPKIFSYESTKKYTITNGSKTVSRDFERISDTSYDAHFFLGDIAAGQTIELTYDLIALPASYGEMVVGDLERNTVGADIYGDVGFKTSTTCGANMILWASGPGSRDYIRTTREFGSTDLPDGLASRLADNNGNGVPDSVENMTLEERRAKLKELTDANVTQNNGNGLFTIQEGDGRIDIGFDPQVEQKVETIAQNLFDGLACGFGGGSCMSFPLNWAPLAPGSDPTLFGIPIGDGLKPLEGIPVFSTLTTMPCWSGVCPSTWPPSPWGAGGYLGEIAPFTSSVRVFITPTLTLGMGTAVCLGKFPSLSGNMPMPGLSPFIQGGNCIVAAMPMPFCKGDGSDADGDVSGISGLGTLSDTWNASSCSIKPSNFTKEDDKKLTQSIIDYLKNPQTSQLNSIYKSLQNRGATLLNGTPLLRVGASSGGTELSIEIDSNTKLADIGKVVKLNNKRIASFPDFLMNWLTRQIEELTTSLFTPPNLTIIPPTDFGQNAQVDSTYKNFFDKLGTSYSQASLSNIKQAMGTAYTNTKADPNAPKMLQGAKANLNALKAAYNFIGKLPFVKVRQVNIPINIPWIKANELDKYSLAMAGYKAELDRAMASWCVSNPTKECLDQKAKIQNGALVNSINQNLQRIEEYKRFPIKLQKYITWKERYITQILCNIDTIQQITTGWLRDNGIRFRKWAELFVLIKAIADSWQPILDIFNNMSTSCGVCRNERYNLQYWKFKLLSMLIPSPPVIRFPKWPDIILDLSDVRFGIDVALPTFDIRMSPIRLPNLPNLSIGNISASLTLPAIPVLPPLPNLPDLPDLPSLPKIKLPDLPPPPKLPKLGGVLKAAVNILKLISKMYCYYQKTVLIPEWQAGDVIAQRTERQGTLPFDFINLQMPQFSLPSIREIRVASHVNFEIRSDFIAEFARSAVKPINQFQTDIQNAIPNKIAPDVSIPSNNINVRINQYTPDTHKSIQALMNDIEKDKDIWLDGDEFHTLLLQQLSDVGLDTIAQNMEKGLKKVSIESNQIQQELLTFNNKKWDAVREVVESSRSDMIELQNIIDLLQRDIHTEVGQMVADTPSQNTTLQSALGRLDALQSQDLKNERVQGDVGLDASVNRLNNKLSRMIAANGEHGTNSNSNLPPGYAPNYQGIYVRTPITGVQTRLFDYIDALTDATRVDTVDIDKDGDLDYIFTLDNILYVKYSHFKTPNKANSSSSRVIQLGQNDPTPYVPNALYSDPKTTKSLNFSFAPASPNDRAWRAEIYDHYIEWDKVANGTHNESEVPKVVIDLFTQENTDRQTSDNPISSIPVDRALASVQDKNSFVLEGRQVTIYTGALSIAISPGRTLYTGNSRVRVTARNINTSQKNDILLEPNRGYSFNDSFELLTTDQNTKLYLIGEDDGSRYTYSDDLIGLPVLPGMHIYASDAGAMIRDVREGRSITLAAGVVYYSYNLGAPSDQYNVTIPYPDGYSYLRLASLTPNKNDRTRPPLLISAQRENDTGAPVVDLPSQLRIPVYAKRSFPLKDILSDLGIATLRIDEDTTIDSNNDGIYDNDFTPSGSRFSLSSSDLTIGPFTAPGNYTFALQTIDDMGNMSVNPLEIEVYSPIPNIDVVTASGWIQGKIDTSDAGEPIHFFRVRPSETPTLLSTLPTYTLQGGTFASGSFFAQSERIFLSTTSSALEISPQGVLALPYGYRMEVDPMSRSEPMRFLLKNNSGSIEYIHVLRLPVGTQIRSASTAGSDTSTGVLVTLGNARLVSALSSDPAIPNGAYLTDGLSRAFAAIAQDGNIAVLDQTVSLRYAPQGDILTIEVVRGTEILATIKYKLDFFYTSK